MFDLQTMVGDPVHSGIPMESFTHSTTSSLSIDNVTGTVLDQEDSSE